MWLYLPYRQLLWSGAILLCAVMCGIQIITIDAAQSNSVAQPNCSMPPTRNMEPQIDCSLEIHGYGNQPGIKTLRINCSSTSNPTYKLPIGIASHHLNHSVTTVAEQLRLYSRGVTYQTSGMIPCQKQSEEPAASAEQVPLYAVLYFCEGSVRLVNPVIRDIGLPYWFGQRNQEDTAVLGFGGSVQAIVTGAQIEGNDGSTAIAVFNNAKVSIERSAFIGNFGNPGSGVFTKDDAVVDIVASEFIQNDSSDFGGAVAVMGSSFVTVISSEVARNRAKSGGGGLYALENATLVLCNTSVLQNQAEMGGGVQSWAKLYIYNSTVAENAAIQQGGGLAIQSGFQMPYSSELYISPDSSITANSAAEGGGAYINTLDFASLEPSPSPLKFDPVMVKQTIVNNTALRTDNDVTTDAAKLTLLSKADVIDYVGRPGDDGLLNVKLRVSDVNGIFACGGRTIEAYWADSGAPMTADKLQQAILNSPTGVAGVLGPLKLSNVSLPDGTVNMALRFQQPPGVHTIVFQLGAADGEPGITANMTVKVRNCTRGEKQIKPGVCEPCPNGTYSFEASTTQCLQCPTNAYCPGGDAVISKEGYWQSSRYSDQIHRCLNPGACDGNRLTLQETCSAANSLCLDEDYVPKQCVSAAGQSQGGESPYEGSLCGKCAPGYGSIRPFNCQPCMKAASVIAMYVTAAIGMLLYIKLLCHFTLAESRQQDVVLALSAQKVQPTHLLHHLVLHGQYILIIASAQMGDGWPASITWALKALAWIWSPASPETLAPECLNMSGSLLPPGVQKIVFYLAMPFVMIAFLLLIELVVMFTLQKDGMRGMLRDRLLATCMVVAFFFLPAIARTAFSLFACVKIDDPKQLPSVPKAVGWFFIHGLDQRCFQGWHRQLALGLGIPLCILICLAPISILLITLKNRKHLKDPEFLQHYYFLVQYYSPKYCYWEAVVCAQTITLVAISVFGFNLGSENQALLMNITVLAFGLLLLFVRPLAHKEAAKVAHASMGCLFVTSYTALTFAQYGANASTAVIPVYMGVLVVLVNLVFVAWVLWKLALLIDWKSVWRVFKAWVSCDFATARQASISSSRRNMPSAEPVAATSSIGTKTDAAMTVGMDSIKMQADQLPQQQRSQEAKAERQQTKEVLLVKQPAFVSRQ